MIIELPYSPYPDGNYHQYEIKIIVGGSIAPADEDKDINYFHCPHLSALARYSSSSLVLFLPRVSFVSDKSFDYAEKIEKLIQKNK